MVLIDMEMPEGCEDCPLATSDGLNMFCPFIGNDVMPFQGCHVKCPLEEFAKPQPKVSIAVFDQEEIHHGCAVQILTNSVTGETSVGWWEEKEDAE